MKITRTKLRRIIKEEYSRLQKEVERMDFASGATPEDQQLHAPGEGGNDPVEIIGSLFHQHGFMNARESLEQMGFKADFVTSPLPMWMIEKDGVKYAALNKKYAEDPDLIVGEIAIGLMS